MYILTLQFYKLDPEHLDYHKTMENYFKVKSTLFNLLKEKNGKAVINYDDDYGKNWPLNSIAILLYFQKLI